MTEDLEARVRAVERAVTDGETAPADIVDAATATERLAETEATTEELRDRVEELEAAVQALRGYVGNVRSVNRDVEQRADAALAAVDRLQRRGVGRLHDASDEGGFDAGDAGVQEARDAGVQEAGDADTPGASVAGVPGAGDELTRDSDDEHRWGIGDATRTGVRPPSAHDHEVGVGRGDGRARSGDRTRDAGGRPGHRDSRHRDSRRRDSPRAVGEDWFEPADVDAPSGRTSGASSAGLLARVRAWL